MSFGKFGEMSKFNNIAFPMLPYVGKYDKISVLFNLGGCMNNNLRCCSDCINFRTKKVYTCDGKYRIGFCLAFGKDLTYDKQHDCYVEAINCVAYLDRRIV